jgi:hypothetical protein
MMAKAPSSKAQDVRGELVCIYVYRESYRQPATGFQCNLVLDGGHPAVPGVPDEAGILAISS